MNIKKHWCYLCLQRFSTKHILDNHISFCSQFAPQRVEMSKNKYLTFTNYKFQLKAPFVIYADFECFINTEHIPSGFAYVVINNKSEIVYETCYSGDNVMDTFFESILNTYDNLKTFV